MPCAVSRNCNCLARSGSTKTPSEGIAAPNPYDRLPLAQRWETIKAIGSIVSHPMPASSKLLTTPEAREILDVLDIHLCHRVVQACLAPSDGNDVLTHDLLVALELERHYLAWDGQVYVLLTVEGATQDERVTGLVH